MQNARIINDLGETIRTVQAHNADWRLMRELADTGGLCCGDARCNARVVMVPGVNHASHFRALDVHHAQCTNRVNAVTAQQEDAFLAALDGKQPVMIDMVFDLQWGGLRTRYNRPDLREDNAKQGLWFRKSWQDFVAPGGYHKQGVPDIAVLLHFLQLAQEHKGRAALSDKLWFGNQDAVMSFDRFVIANRLQGMQDLAHDFIQRTQDPYWVADARVIESPRLMILSASKAQKKKAKAHSAKSLFAEKIGVPVSERGGYIRDMQPGMYFERRANNLTNRFALKAGEAFWVIGAPGISRDQLQDMIRERDKSERRAILSAAEARKELAKYKAVFQETPDFVGLAVGRVQQFMVYGRDNHSANADSKRAKQLVLA